MLKAHRKSIFVNEISDSAWGVVVLNKEYVLQVAKAGLIVLRTVLAQMVAVLHPVHGRAHSE